MGLAMPYGHLGLPRWPVCKNAYWRALMEEEKKPYEEKSNADKERYQKEMEEYKAKQEKVI